MKQAALFQADIVLMLCRPNYLSCAGPELGTDAMAAVMRIFGGIEHAACGCMVVVSRPAESASESVGSVYRYRQEMFIEPECEYVAFVNPVIEAQTDSCAEKHLR